jgi:SulP family sulfate permease
VREAWHYSRADFTAIAATLGLTLLLGVEIGVIAGVLASIGSFLYTTARPHFAVVGQVPGTEHYRNIDRHDVVCTPGVLSIRIDESLYFANAAYLEEIVYGRLQHHDNIRHIVLMCPAVNNIDLSALEALEDINQRLQENGIRLHLSEVKGPVMDALKRSHFLQHLSGEVFLNHHAAVQKLATV